MQKHRHGGDVYSQKFKADFSANINPLGPPEGVIEAVKNSVSQIQNYPDVNCRRLTKVMAEHENVEEGHLIFGNGAAELIFALAAAFRPKKALLLAPGFAEYEEALEASGCSIQYYELKETHGYEIQQDYFDLITDDLDILFLCNPNNPTGVLIPQKFLVEALARCTKHQVFMVVDECFQGFIDPAETYSMKPYQALFDNLFVLNAFTKLYAIPGLRLGYGITCNRALLEEMQRVTQPWRVSIPAQEAGIAALAERNYVEETRELIRREREYLTIVLKGLGCKVFEAGANFIFFKGPLDLYERCLERGYLIRDCSNYRGLEKGYYRIAVRSKEENTGLLKVLKDLLGTPILNE